MRRWVLLPLLWAPVAASATTIVALPEAELIRHSDAIVVGTVIRTHTVIHAGGQVGTRADVQVHRALRGAEPNQVVIVEVPGGRLKNGLVAYTPGSPQLQGGDMIFGFLERSDSVLRPLGLSYGLLRVRRGSRVYVSGAECRCPGGFETGCRGDLLIRLFQQPYVRDRALPSQWDLLQVYFLSAGSVFEVKLSRIFWLRPTSLPISGISATFLHLN